MSTSALLQILVPVRRPRDLAAARLEQPARADDLLHRAQGDAGCWTAARIGVNGCQTDSRKRIGRGQSVYRLCEAIR